MNPDSTLAVTKTCPKDGVHLSGTCLLGGGESHALGLEMSIAHVAGDPRAVHAALERYGPPEIFNSDQGSQFTSVDFTDVLTEAGIRISMDGKGRWMDNVFIERLWRSLKYECVYLSEFATGSEARSRISWWMDFYNERRPHSSLDDRTPQEAYSDERAARRLGLRPASSEPEQEAA